MIISIILAILTACAVALHGLIVFVMYLAIPQTRQLNKIGWAVAGTVLASGLLHIINFIH